jgi:hypothetical protein
VPASPSLNLSELSQSRNLPRRLIRYEFRNGRTLEFLLAELKLAAVQELIRILESLWGTPKISESPRASVRREPRERPIDFTVQNEGTIYLLHAHTEAAHEWVGEHISDDAMTFGRAIVVEHSYIAGIVDGIQNDGLVVRG